MSFCILKIKTIREKKREREEKDEKNLFQLNTQYLKKKSKQYLQGFLNNTYEEECSWAKCGIMCLTTVWWKILLQPIDVLRNGTAFWLLNALSAFGPLFLVHKTNSLQCRSIFVFFKSGPRQSVIHIYGTLWRTDDCLAALFYDGLLRGGTGQCCLKRNALLLSWNVCRHPRHHTWVRKPHVCSCQREEFTICQFAVKCFQLVF